MIKISDKGIETRLKHISKTIECGLHSGIPTCCIIFYICVWMWEKKLPSNSFFKNYYNDICASGVDNIHPLGKFKHIPCPDCLKNKNYIETIDCPVGLRCDHHDEQAE